MPPALIALIEIMVSSPVVQKAAWSYIKPHLDAGTMPPDEDLVKAYEAAWRAHMSVAKE